MRLLWPPAQAVSVRRRRGQRGDGGGARGEAADRGARVVVLPEVFLTGYDLDASPVRCPVSSTSLEPLRDAAREPAPSWWSAARWPPRAWTPLSSCRVGPDGAVDVPYDKQHLDGDEMRSLHAGHHGASILVARRRAGPRRSATTAASPSTPGPRRPTARRATSLRGVLHRRRAPARPLLRGPRARERHVRRIRRPHGPVRVQRVQRRLRGLRPRGSAAASGSAPSAASSLPTSTPRWSTRIAPGTRCSPTTATTSANASASEPHLSHVPWTCRAREVRQLQVSPV